jgi:hypothetical protein
MRSIIFAAVVSLASVSYGQGGVWYGGPYQPSRVSPGFVYYNSTAPVYPVAANPFGGYYGGYGWQQQQELRRIRWELEEANFNRRLRRR